jgi:Fe-S cluster biogenesis protein NfuA
VSWLARLWKGSGERARVASALGDPGQIALVENELVRLRPMLAADGGDVELVEVQDGVVRLRMVGACRSCSASAATLAHGLEPALKERLAWVRSVEAVS